MESGPGCRWEKDVPQFSSNGLDQLKAKRLDSRHENQHQGFGEKMKKKYILD